MLVNLKKRKKYGKISKFMLGDIENDAYVLNFIITSQEEKVTNEITGFLY